MDTDKVSIAPCGDMFTIPCGSGYSTLGFDEAQRCTRAIADWLKRPDLAPAAPRGTLDSYAEYQRATQAGAARNARTGARCPADLHPKLIGLEGRRVEVTNPDGTKERFEVGKSMGWYPVHLSLHNRGAHGGMAISPLSVFASVRVIR